jgi:hypothetical protein
VHRGEVGENECKHGEVITQQKGTDQVRTLKDKVRRQQVELERLPGTEHVKKNYSYVTDRPGSAAGGFCVSSKGSRSYRSVR